MKRGIIMNHQKYTYCYDPNQAKFYMSHGLKCVKKDISRSTGKSYWSFDWNASQPIYDLWMNRMYGDKSDYIKYRKEHNLPLKNPKTKITYIYNIYKANFYMKYGLRCLGTGFNSKTHLIYWTFDTEETIPLTAIWEKHNRLINRQKQPPC